jgi:hypothetical protein
LTTELTFAGSPSGPTPLDRAIAGHWR